MKKIKGILSINPRGFGFVSPLSSKEEDIFISKDDINGAFDKDLVEVKIIKKTEKGLDGRIIKILKKGRKYFVVTIYTKSKKSYTCVSSFLPGKKIFIPRKKKLKKGDRLLVTITTKNHLLCAKIIKHLGNISDSSSDKNVTCKEFEIKTKFPKKALLEAKKIQISKQDFKNRKDFSNLHCITIDPEDAKDFDDAISISTDKNFHLAVHIADVSNFVKQNSFLDKEAFARANSTYFPETVIPMLPENLSNDICSLKENALRLTVSVLMDFDKNGNLYNYEIVKSFIKIKKKYSYKKAFLEIKKNKDIHFKNFKKLFLLLKKKREERGSIDFSLPETKIEVDKKANPINIKIEEYDTSHQMIEEFMLKANEVVAYHLFKKQKILIYRTHEKPKSKSLEDFYTFARMLGFHLPPSPSNKDLQNLFIQAKKTKFLYQLSLNFIKSMNIAFYSPENLGHYGLFLDHYCHFTSPIRRYSDLTVHRLLFEKAISKKELKKIAKICSEKEKNSFKAEKSIIYIKKLRFLLKNLKEKNERAYIATITKIKPYFIYFELNNILLQGYLHISDLHDDYFIYNEENMSLEGSYSNKRYKYGDKIKVEIIHISLINLDVHWALK